MPELVIDEIEADVLDKLQLRARGHGRSTKEEIREILRGAVKSDGSAPVGLGTRLAERFRGIGLDEEIPELRSTSVDEH